MALVVNLLGGPGAGKSTTAAGVFSMLKLHGVNCELVTEFAKELTWEERFKTLGDQLYILAKQHHRLWRLKEQVDVIITDAPIMQSLAYTKDSTLRSLILSREASFDNLYYFIERCKPYSPNGRNQNEDSAKNLCHMIHKELTNNVQFNTVMGNHTGINEIALDILERFGLQKFLAIY